MKMRKRTRRYKRVSKTKEVISRHIEKNSSIYFFLCVLFLVGIASGVFFITGLTSTQKLELGNYLNNQIELFSNTESNYLKGLIIENILLILTMWFAGITIVGIIINFIILIYKGFCIGYTISALTLSLGMGKAFLFVLSGMFLQNILIIPALIGTAVSGLRFFKEILQNRDKENLIIGIIRHTFFSLLMALIAVCSSFIEIYISNSMLNSFSNLFI